MRLYVFTAFVVLFLGEVFSILPHRIPVRRVASHHGIKPLMGVIHVHSTYSDGGGSASEIIQAGQDAGLDFLVLTDHNNAQARRDGLEKRYGNLDFFVEMEASVIPGHAISFFSQTSARNFSDENVNALSEDYFIGKPTWFPGHTTPPGFFTVIAHPSNIKQPWTRLDRFPDGIEVMNFDSFWQRQLYDSVADFGMTAALYPLNHYLAALRFFQIYRKDFVAWDAMNSLSKGHFAIIGHDTHSNVRLGHQMNFRWPSYLETFRLASNVVFIKGDVPTDFEQRKRKIYETLHEGRSAMIFQSLYPFEGNDWWLRCDQKEFRSGDEVALNAAGHCTFVIETPASMPYPTTVQLWKDGELHREVAATTNHIEIPVNGRGNYRVEVWVRIHSLLHVFLDRPLPYLFYNPIYVR